MHLYIHIPFCARRCSYCDFAIAVRRTIPSDQFVRVVLAEWDRRQADPIWESSGPVRTVYFGGGTPSRLDPLGVGQILAAIQANRPVLPNAEVTLEANPDDVTRAAAAAWRRAGINRVSLGVQSFDPGVLVWMHRTQTADQNTAAAEILRGEGIENLSVDLIYGLPPSLGRVWERDLDLALGLQAQHLSLYGLTVEPGTPLGKWTVRGLVQALDEDGSAREYLAAHAKLNQAGYQHYEVSNAARPGFAAVHNSAYWARKPFLGLGPSAHSGSGPWRAWNIRDWEAYRRAVEAGQPSVAESETLTPAQIRLEDIYLGLRTTAGIPLEWVAPATLAQWTAAGWAETRANRVVLTVEGWLRLDALVARVQAS